MIDNITMLRCKGVAKRALVAFFSGTGKGRDFTGNVTVDLTDASSAVIASVNFTRTDLTSGAADGDDGFIYKSVQGGGVKCPRSFDGAVRIRNVQPSSPEWRTQATPTHGAR